MPQDAKHHGVKKIKRLSRAKKLVRRATQAAADHKAKRLKRKIEANQQMKLAVEKALRAVTPTEIAEVNANPKLARKVNETAAIRAAAEYGVDIRKPNGKIDYKKARKAAEIAAIQSAAEMGFDITDKRGKISRRKALKAARAVEAARNGDPVDSKVSDFVKRQDAKLADAFRDAQGRGFDSNQLRRDAIQSDPGLARLVAEEAVIQAAEKAGVNIFKDDGSLDYSKARNLALSTAIQSAQEMGIDITDKRGKISRLKALQAARIADAARAGKPLNVQVASAVSRQDARISAAYKQAKRRQEAEGKGQDFDRPASRQEAYTDAELAALVRQSLLKKIR